MKGTVKWFNLDKGFGFLGKSDGSGDVFVHVSAVQKAGLSTLNPGEDLEFDLQASGKGPQAHNLKLLSPKGRG